MLPGNGLAFLMDRAGRSPFRYRITTPAALAGAGTAMKGDIEMWLCFFVDSLIRKSI